MKTVQLQRGMAAWTCCAFLVGCAGPPATRLAPIAFNAASPVQAAPKPVAGMRTSAAGEIALDGSHVYWVVRDQTEVPEDPDADYPSRLFAADQRGGPSVQLLALPTGASDQIAVDDDNIYLGTMGRRVDNPDSCEAILKHHPRALCDGGAHPPTVRSPTGTVLAVPKRGGALRILASNARAPIGLATDGQWVFWSDGNDIFRVPREGGEHEALAGKSACPVMVVDDAYLYCRGNSVVFRIPKSGGTPETLGETTGYGDGLAIDPERMLFSGLVRERLPQPDPSAVARCSMGQSAAPCPDPWIREVPTLMMAGKDGTGSRAIAPLVDGLVVFDQTTAYWMDESGQLLRSSLDGGPAALLVSKSGKRYQTPRGLATDGAHVWWITPEGKLMRVP